MVGGQAQRAAALDRPIAPASQRAYVPWGSIIEDRKPGDAYGLYSKPPISLIPQRLVSAERAISNLEEITAELLTTGDGVDARLGMLDEDVERERKRISLLSNRHDEELAALDRRLEAVTVSLGDQRERLSLLEKDHGERVRQLTALESQSKHKL